MAQLREHKVQFEPAWLVLSGVLYLVGMAPACLFWRRVLRVLGQEAGLLKTIRAYYIGHLGKYVPGKALVVVLRAGMVGGERVNITVAAATVFIETLTMMASGSVIAAVLIAVQPEQHWQYVAGAIVCVLAAGLPTLPPVFAWIMRRSPVGRTTAAAADRNAADRLSDAGDRLDRHRDWLVHHGLESVGGAARHWRDELGADRSLPLCTIDRVRFRSWPASCR